MGVLSNIAPFAVIDALVIKNILDRNLKSDSAMVSLINSINSDFVETNNRNPNLEEARQIQVSAYALSR